MRQSGGRGQYGHVWLKIEPREPGAGYEFVNGIVGGVVPKEYIPAVDKGVQEQMQNGVLAGFPLVDVKVTLFDGSYHDVDSNEMAFKIAASMATKKLAQQQNLSKQVEQMQKDLQMGLGRAEALEATRP